LIFVSQQGQGRLEEHHCRRVTDKLDWLEQLKLHGRWIGLKSVDYKDVILPSA
jgi:hypothetical protein